MIQFILKKIYYKLLFYKNKIRIFKIKALGAKIGKGTIAYGRFTVVNFTNLEMGENCRINEGVNIDCRDLIKIGNNVHLSSNVQVHTGKLILDIFPRRHAKAPITIEDNVWLATNVVVLAGVTIGENSIIAAGSIVTKDIEKNSIAMGSPAKVVKKI